MRILEPRYGTIRALALPRGSRWPSSSNCWERHDPQNQRRGRPELAWFKSSYSDGPDGETCVEIAHAPGVVHVRDSEDADVPSSVVGSQAWGAFVTYGADV
ncbi:DUF397 domain-containing protein [Streptomyces sp. NPDC097107]|uniref:DUF397 domain-containing protein n=1 Tax=Streptomyces sp. NPDC097107 TaxID=3366089 RepID=UPI0038096F68